jgi:hypothetical protein
MPTAGPRSIRIGCSGFEEWSRDAEVLAYFSNDWEVFAVRNALWLKNRLGV